MEQLEGQWEQRSQVGWGGFGCRLAQQRSGWGSRTSGVVDELTEGLCPYLQVAENRGAAQ